MAISGLGYRKDLFVLPFDHRSSFERGLLGISGWQADPREVEQLSGYKRVIYEGLLEAVESGIPKESTAILVDQKYGAQILADAREEGTGARRFPEVDPLDQWRARLGVDGHHGHTLFAVL